MFYVAWGNAGLWELGSKVFYDNLIASMDNIIHNVENAPKMQLYFSHDYSLSIIVNGLGDLFNDEIPFASTLFFELHLENG